MVDKLHIIFGLLLMFLLICTGGEILSTPRVVILEQAARSLAQSMGHSQMYPLHILAVALGDDECIGFDETIFRILSDSAQKKGKNICKSIREDVIKSLESEIPRQSPPPREVSYSGEFEGVLLKADKFRESRRDTRVAVIHIMYGLARDPGVSKVLKKREISTSSLDKAIVTLLAHKSAQSLDEVEEASVSVSGWAISGVDNFNFVQFLSFNRNYQFMQ
jgi:ATP-dependent Clp protease ATP-binding subunit ClpA